MFELSNESKNTNTIMMELSLPYESKNKYAHFILEEKGTPVSGINIEV
jgi:hypothetical protein